MGGFLFFVAFVLGVAWALAWIVRSIHEHQRTMQVLKLQAELLEAADHVVDAGDASLPLLGQEALERLALPLGLRRSFRFGRLRGRRRFGIPIEDIVIGDRNRAQACRLRQLHHPRGGLGAV